MVSKREMDLIEQQKFVCNKYGAAFIQSLPELKIGISLNVKDHIYPINGLRHQTVGDTTGWYIWAGEEFSNDENFFLPLHVKHLHEWSAEILKYLGLPPGWRFLIGPDAHEDVWEDRSLLEV